MSHQQQLLLDRSLKTILRSCLALKAEASALLLDGALQEPCSSLASNPPCTFHFSNRKLLPPPSDYSLCSPHLIPQHPENIQKPYLHSMFTSSSQLSCSFSPVVLRGFWVLLPPSILLYLQSPQTRNPPSPLDILCPLISRLRISWRKYAVFLLVWYKPYWLRQKNTALYPQRPDPNGNGSKLGELVIRGQKFLENSFSRPVVCGPTTRDYPNKMNQVTNRLSLHLSGCCLNMTAGRARDREVHYELKMVKKFRCIFSPFNER